MSAQTKSISYNCLDGCRGHQAWLGSGNTSVGWSVGDSRNISISTDRQTIKNAQDPDAFLNNEFHLSRACVLQDLLHDRTRPRCKRLSVIFLIALLLVGLPIAVWLDLSDLVEANLRHQASDVNSIISSVRHYYAN